MTLDRSDAVNLASHVIGDTGRISDKGVRTLADAVLKMDGEIERLRARIATVEKAHAEAIAEWAKWEGEAKEARQKALEDAAELCLELRFKNPEDGEAACNECAEGIRAILNSTPKDER